MSHVSEVFLHIFCDRLQRWCYSLPKTYNAVLTVAPCVSLRLGPNTLNGIKFIVVLGSMYMTCFSSPRNLSILLFSYLKLGWLPKISLIFSAFIPLYQLFSSLEPSAFPLVSSIDWSTSAVAYHHTIHPSLLVVCHQEWRSFSILPEHHQASQSGNCCDRKSRQSSNRHAISRKFKIRNLGYFFYLLHELIWSPVPFLSI